MDDDKPVTRKELMEALGAFKTEFKAEFKSELIPEIREMVTEIVRDSQTELLRAFLNYQEGNSLRVRALEVKLSNVDAGLSLRVELVERRLLEIELKLKNPPAA